jgi:hypothetical protein
MTRKFVRYSPDVEEHLARDFKAACPCHFQNCISTHASW